MPRGDSDGTTRRRHLKHLAAAGLLGAVAGCTSGGGGGDGGGGDSGSGDDSGSSGDSGSGDDSGSDDSGSSGSGGSGPIQVGNLSPFSGGLGWIGPNAAAAIELGLSEINEATVLGREIEVSRQDSETNPQAAINGFKTLDSSGMQAVIGPSSTVMPSLVEPAQNAQLAIVSPMTGTLQLDEIGGEWIWRTVPSDSIAGRAQAQYAYSDKGYRSMALSFKNDKGSESFATAVGDYFETLGGSVETEVALDPNADSYRSEVQTLMDAGVEVVSMTAATEVSSLFIKNYTELGAEFDMFLSNDVITQSFIDEVGVDAMDGMFGQAPAPGPANEGFVERYEEMHGESPGAFANSAYDALNLIALAFQKEGEVSRAAIKNHLYDLGNPPGTQVTTFPEGKEALENGEEIDYVGAANPQNFDQTGDPLGPFSVLQVQDGAWSTVKTYEAETLSE